MAVSVPTNFSSSSDTGASPPIDECWYNQHSGLPSGIVDATIVATHMVLEAEDLGLGSVYIGAFNPDIVVKNFEIPENHKIAMLLFMGYRSEDSVASEMHSTFKSDEELFEELKIRK